MSPFYILIVCLLIGSASCTNWDVAVAHQNALEFFLSDGTLVSIFTQQFQDLTGVVFDPSEEKIYLSDASHDESSIFQMDIKTNRAVSLLPKQVFSVQGVAYHARSKALYWTNGKGHSISMMNLVGNRSSTTLINFIHKQIPMGIAIDNCNDVLYWTNSYHLNPSIERSALDGSDRRIIASDHLFQPLGITVDQPARRLYWTDDQEGISYKIERSHLDGTHRETVYKSTHHTPFAITVGPEMVFWTDWIRNAVWTISKHGHDSEPTMLRRYRAESPMGLAANISTSCEEEVTSTKADVKTSTEADVTTYANDEPMDHRHNEQPLDHEYCLHQGQLIGTSGQCKCNVGYSGKRCEVQECFNFCLNGSCYLDTHGSPQCQCQLGYKGDRCHVDVCEGYCLGGGRCNVGSDGEPICECMQNTYGMRCQSDPISYTVENSSMSGLIDHQRACVHRTEQERVAVIVLGCVILVMTAMVGMLARKVCILKKRPRIKKHIIVKKNVTPMTSRPAQGEQCEITIENCCNMNICETPCFEPQLRTPKTQSKKEEKKNLLGSMEEEAILQDDLY